MGEAQRVEPAELTKQSAEMRGVDWHNPFARTVAPPDALPSSAAAVANLNANAQSLLEFQRWAETENQRIAETLQIAADAYTRVDETCGRAIEDPARQAAVESIVVPAPATPPPAPPHPVGAPQRVDAGGYSDVHNTQADLTAGDDGASLKAAMLQWGLAAGRVRDNAPRPPSGDWEGRAADAAYARMAEFGGWLEQLAEGWRDLAEAAAKIVAAHDAAMAEHAGIHGEYVSLETQLRQLAAQTTVGGGLAARDEMARIQNRLQELQQRSDEVRREYASGATFSPVRPEMPAARGGDSAGAVGAPGCGGRPAGDPAGLAQQMAPSFGRRAGATADKPGGGARSVGQPGGGAPAGDGAQSGGSGSGGGTSAGAPGPPMRTPTTDPRVRPAAASGGAGAGRGGGGAGGGGMPATPMSAPVTAERVAPAPSAPAVAGAAPGSATDGRAMAGMGGMAPMAHGAGAPQGKEKRRDPKVAPDESLYTEDRPWTEAVIGNHRRRRALDDHGSREDR